MEALKKVKPYLRGHFHQAAFFMSLGACAMLIASAEGSRALAATIIYSVSLSGLYGMSALYHRPTWQEITRKWLRRLDHSFIFILIAGTATPICLLGMPTESGDKALWVFWLTALAGVLKSVFWTNSPKWISALLYLAMGWLVVPYFPEISSGLTGTQLHLLLAGGIIYSVGAFVYALKRPNPFPQVFGYHEIFHALVIVASVFHFVVIFQLVN